MICLLGTVPVLGATCRCSGRRESSTVGCRCRCLRGGNPAGPMHQEGSVCKGTGLATSSAEACCSGGLGGG